MDEGQPDQGPDPSVEIRVDLAPRITFATHHCGHPVLNKLVVSNPLPDDLRDLTLTLSVHPEILGKSVWRIECIPAGSEFNIPESELSVPISDGMLGQLDERLCVELRFELTQPGGDGNAAPLAGTSHRLEALPRDEWGGGDHMPDLLAAFVLPDDPAVDRLINRASHILALHGKTALDGYGSKPPGQVWEMLCGIWHATAAMNIDSAEIPSGFAAQGQRIHFPHVMEARGRAGSLDMALLLAGSMERAGLNPVVVLMQGRALTGAYLQRRNLPSLTVDDPVELRKAVQARELAIFDPAGAHKDRLTTFSAAIEAATGQMAEDREHEFAYALDIQRARDEGIKPLPPPPDPPPPPPEPRLTSIEIPWEGPPDLPEPVPVPPPSQAGAIDRWKRSLLDLTRGNRLLNLRYSISTIRILCPEPARLEDRLAQRQSIRVVPVKSGPDGSAREHFIKASWDERDEVVADIDDESGFGNRMVNLYRKAKAELEEGGSNTLFLALGMLRWASRRGERPAHAPLILLPVSLRRASAVSMPRITHHDDDPVFNLTLIEMLRQDFEIDLSELANDLPKDDSGVDVPGVWETVRRKVREVPGFEVTEDVVLSTFSFAKYLMWKDLDENTEMLKRSNFVRRLIDRPPGPYESGAKFIKPHEVDERIQPKDLLTPLNADASQIAAVHASAGDGDFVLEGPPGTGKSETIANIIAHNLGMGRRVLFVSEKMAALDVVHRRLSECGLGPFCLELHSTKGQARAVIGQLDTAWQEQEGPGPGPDEWEKETGRLEVLRDELNDAVKALHADGPSERSPHRLMGRALRYGECHIRLDDDWGTGPDGNGHAPQTRQELDNLKDLARRIGDRFKAIQREDLEVLADITKTDPSIEWQDQVKREAERLRTAIGELIRLAADDPRIREAPAPAWVDEHASTERRIGPLRWISILRLRLKMSKALRGDAPTPPMALVQWGRSLLIALRMTETEVPPLEDTLGTLAMLQEIQPQIGRIKATLPDTIPWREPTPDIAGRHTGAAATLVRTHRNFEKGLRAFRQSTCLDPAVPGPGLDALLRATTIIVEDPERFTHWIRWTEARTQAAEAGIVSVVKALETGGALEGGAEDAFETAYSLWFAPKLINQRRPIRAFDGKGHDDTIRKFRLQDMKVTELAAAQIRENIRSGNPIPPYSGGGEPGHLSGFDALRRELKKKKGHLPPRRLIKKMEGAILALTPCLMMSPLSVAQFLPARPKLFDLVVFDEASQITVPNAIGAIARGKRCIVVGDSKQLPPTSFFDRGGDDDENEEDHDQESILDEAGAAGVPSRRLTGHYRSKHESLIAFSNYTYYDGELITYPSAKTRDSMVSLRQVDGLWNRGTTRTNQDEAKAVVEEVVRRLQDPDLCQLSIGIVTMNQQQQRLIEELLDNELRKHKELEIFFTSDSPVQDPVFVKNLETVQGDERDVILLSIGYGPTDGPRGKVMSMNLGPLTKAGGEKRLNVAITRATTEVIVFTSFRASMMRLRKTSAQGMKDLKAYLDFAARGPVALGQAITSVGGEHDYESDFEMMVAHQLRDRGWEVRTQVGISKYRIDLGIVHPDRPGEFLAGVECDGASYHSSPAARDRDRIRQMVLEERYDWRLLRVWSTDFFRTPEAAIKQVDDKLREFLDDDRKNPEAGESEDTTEGDGCPPTDE